MKISFIGLGQMGKGMAMNLAKCGCDYLVSDVSDKMFPEFEAKGIRTSKNIADAYDSEIICLCLPDTKIVESVTIGAGGLIEHLKPGQIVVDFSTIAYLPTLKIAETLAAQGVDFLDCPMSGRKARADDGTLTIMCAGKEEIYNRLRPYLELMGRDIIYMGQSGNGQLTKMINNCIYNINIAAFCELLTVAVKLGLEPQKIGAVINTGSAKSDASAFFVPQILEGNFDYGFTMDDAYKDIMSCVEITSLRGLPIPLTDAMNTIYKMALAKGYGDKYKGAMVRVYEDSMGVKVRKRGFENT